MRKPEQPPADGRGASAGRGGRPADAGAAGLQPAGPETSRQRAGEEQAAPGRSTRKGAGGAGGAGEGGAAGGGGPAGAAGEGSEGGGSAERVRHPLAPNLGKNLQVLRRRLGFGISFDISIQEIVVGGRPAAVLAVDGLVSGALVQRLMQHLISVPGNTLADVRENAAEHLRRTVIGYYDVEVVETLDEVVDQVLAGLVCVLVDGDTHALIVDMRSYPARAVEEPDLERVTRGARDGFIETLLYNSALIRRRIRDPRLRMEALTAGRRSKTNIVLCYLDGVTPRYLPARLKKRIEEVDTDGLPMGTKSLEEYITGIRFNPLPIVRYTERPDVVAAHLLEGYVAILVDTTPQAMILPATAWSFMQHAEEYFQNPTVGTYLRWIRALGFFASFLLVPLWLGLVVSGPPPALSWVGPKGPAGVVPLLWQFLVLEVGIDVTRQAFVHTPTPLASSLGIIAAVLLGEFAVKVGLFTNEVVLYSALAAIGFFAIPNLEFALAVRLLRYLTIIPAGLWGIPGVLSGLFLIFLIFLFTRSFGIPYLWPLLPPNVEALVRVFLRSPIPTVRTRTLPGVEDRYTKPPTG
ncbi:MAG TPA: spore germination protein [Firmicutes bacterium]|nr:spore germination protein [Bacillota bacterium]